MCLSAGCCVLREDTLMNTYFAKSGHFQVGEDPGELLAGGTFSLAAS